MTGGTPMRIFFTMILLMLLAAVGILALENRGDTTIHYFGRSLECPQALLIAVIYVGGMVSGWFLLGFVRHLFQKSKGGHSTF
jgi:uncharacterized integral membrane protein